MSLPGEETRSIDVNDDRIVAIDEIRDAPHLDRVAPGVNVSTKPRRTFFGMRTFFPEENALYGD
jgi:hypothetical protein